MPNARMLETSPSGSSDRAYLGGGGFTIAFLAMEGFPIPTAANASLCGRQQSSG